MHDISLFLFKNWLPVGIAAIVFFVIGLLLAKCIWGRFSSRLSFAVEENLNLASQWSALVSSQRDLFKKLRSRWQDDRDSWELRLAENEKLIARKDERIEELVQALSRDGKISITDPANDKETQERIASLEAIVAEKESEIAELKTKVSSMPQAVVFSNPSEEKSEAATSTDADDAQAADLQSRIRDLEQDLIDTHDELHDVRAGYRQQVDLVESLEAKLIEAPAASKDLIAANERIAELESDMTENSVASRRAAQLAAIAAHRSRELFGFRSDLVSLQSDNSRLSSELESAKDTEELDRQIKELSADLETVSEKFDGVSAELSDRTEELESARRRLDQVAPIERRHELLKVDLNDAFHEMYDVRSALNERLDEIGLLEARLDELDEVEEERDTLSQELADTRHELSDVRIAFNEKLGEYERTRAEMEELEAIIEDRSAEVNDLSAEVREKRDLVRELKNKLAEHEGELEALNEETLKTASAFSSKAAFSEEQSRRIADLEALLGEHHDQMNAARSRWDDEAKSAKYNAARARQLEAELERREAEFAASHIRITTTENALEAANQRISQLTDQLDQSDSTISKLEEDVRRLSQEKDETLKALEQTTQRVEDLEKAASEREEKLKSFEETIRLRDESIASLDAGAEERDQRIAELETELSDKNGLIEERETLAADRAEKAGELEVLLVEREKALENTKSDSDQMAARIAELETELAEKNGSLEFNESLVSERAEKILELETLLEERDGELSASRDEAAEHVARIAQIEAEKDGHSKEMVRDLKRLNVELESAIAEKESSKVAIAELEGVLKASDSKTLELSQQLEEKLGQHAEFETDLATVKNQLTAREAAEADSEKQIAELEERLAARQTDHSEADVVNNANADEIMRLTEEIRSQQGHLNRYAQQKEESLQELERLRSKVSKRGDSIRELQSQISTIMMQRASRDNEISLLKDKLRAVELELRKSGKVGQATSQKDGDSESNAAIGLEAAIKQSLAVESENPGASLDEIEDSGSHHEPATIQGDSGEGSQEEEQNAVENEDLSVYFDESSDTLSDDALKKVDQCARTVKQSANKLGLTVIGFAGSEGSSNFTESLSARRADSVRQRLLERGVPQNRISVQSAGQDRRYSDWKARRVEMILAPQAVAESIN